jgi:dTDP-glucose pyrophosphorylase
MRLAKYQNRDLDHLCARDGNSIRETMGIMNQSGLRLVPVISDADGSFIGVVADGDLRRFLVAGGNLEDKVTKAANTSPVISSEDASSSEIRSLMLRRGIEYLPLVIGDKLQAFYVLWAANTPKQLTAVIMAGGLGSRLAPLTDNCPKPLLELGGKPILSHIMEHLRDQGVTRFILSVNYLSEMIVDYYGDGTALDVSIEYAHETKRLGTGGALGMIDTEALSDPFLCLNGDLLSDIEVNDLQHQHRAENWDATMVVREHSYTVPYGVVRQSDGGQFMGSDEKPTMTFKINAGIYMLSKSVLSAIPRNSFYDLPTLFDDLRTREMRGGTYTHHGRWIDIGNFVDLDRARKIYEEKPHHE